MRHAIKKIGTAGNKALGSYAEAHIARVEIEKELFYQAYFFARHVAYPFATLPPYIALLSLLSNLFIPLVSLLIYKCIPDPHRKDIIGILPSLFTIFMPYTTILNLATLFVLKTQFFKKNTSRSFQIAFYIFMKEIPTLIHYRHNYLLYNQLKRELSIEDDNIDAIAQRFFTVTGNSAPSSADVILIGESHNNSTHTALENTVLAAASEPTDVLLLEGMEYDPLGSYGAVINTTNTVLWGRYNNATLFPSPVLAVNGWEQNKNEAGFEILSALEKTMQGTDAFSAKKGELGRLLKRAEELQEIISHTYSQTHISGFDISGEFKELQTIEGQQKEIMDSLEAIQLSPQAHTSNPDALRMLDDPDYHDKKLLLERNDDMCTSIKSMAYRFFGAGRTFVITGSRHIDPDSSVHECLEDAGIQYSALIPKS